MKRFGYGFSVVKMDCVHNWTVDTCQNEKEGVSKGWAMRADVSEPAVYVDLNILGEFARVLKSFIPSTTVGDKPGHLLALAI